MIELFTNEVSMTQNLGFYLGEMLEPGDIILLSGELGSGKTQFTKGIARGLMSEQEPRSPTFVLLAKYKGRMDIYHADLYRLDNGYPEVFDIGLDEVMHSNGVTIVEWAEKAFNNFLEDHLWVHFEVIEYDHRKIRLYPKGRRYEQLLIHFSDRV